MENLSRIKNFSKNFYLLLSFLLVVIPLYYILYWAFINHLPGTLVTVNAQSTPFIPFKLSMTLQLIGFMTSVLPASALLYGLIKIRKLFSFYKEGIIFSFEHVGTFKSISKALLLWVLLSIMYESAKSVLFTIGAPLGSRVLSVTFTSAEMATLMVGGMLLVIAWVMEEGRILAEEKELTI